MEEWISEIYRELNETRRLLKEVHAVKADLPEGSLEITTIRGHARYYAVKNGERTYLKKDQIPAASLLAKRTYCGQLERLLRSDVRAMDLFLKHYTPSQRFKLYEALPEARKQLFRPLIPTDEEFLESWRSSVLRNETVFQNSFSRNQNYITENGEAVRSKSEKIIADLLLSMNVPYFYEAPLLVNGSHCFPDFTALNLRTRTTYYWEHFGMMDDESYREDIPKRIARYESANIRLGERLITSWESSTCPLDVRRLKETVRYYLL